MLDDEPRRPDRAVLRRVALLWLYVPLFFALFLFLPAGTIRWVRGWLFVLVVVVSLALAAVYLWRVNPEIYVARSRFRPGAKGWDKVLLCFLFPAMVAVYPVAAIDDARFGWSDVPWWGVAIGYALLLAGQWLTSWAEAVNKFFEPVVRIQTDRGHKVIDTGPYAYVRHPGYLAGFGVSAGSALALGSLWALVPAAVACALLVLRTHWEDQTLREELAGYEEYTQRTRYRLVPGVW